MARPGALTLELGLDQFRTPAIARVAGGALLAQGFFVVMATVNAALLASSWWLWLGIVPFGLLGLAALAVSPFLYAGRGWASILGLAVAALGGLACAGWVAWFAIQLAFAPAVYLSVFPAVLAVLLTPFAIGPSLRVSKARRLLKP